MAQTYKAELEAMVGEKGDGVEGMLDRVPTIVGWWC
jgi:hypothetical protein